MIRTFLDHRKQAHTLDLDALLLDGVPCITVQSNEHSVQFETEQGNVTCELAHFWSQIAGPDLTAREAGTLLVECLARQILLQYMTRLLAQAGSLEAAAPALGWLTTRLDPLAQKAMSAYDGSEAITEAIARIVQQSPATIRAWAQQLGLEASRTPTQLEEAEEALALSVEAPALPLPVEGELASAISEAKQTFHWTSERSQMLEQALVLYPDGTVAKRTRQIAAHYDWPIQPVSNKLYELQRQRRDTKPAARESEHAEQPQEEDRRAGHLETVPTGDPIAFI